MTNEELNKKINSAFTNIAPDNFHKIFSDSKMQKGSVVNMTTNKRFNVKKLTAIAAAFVILVVGFAFVAINPVGDNIVSTVSIDVNPSVNIQLDKDEKVIDVIPFNEDGKKIIGTMDFKGSDLTVTINALIGSMLRNGFLSELTNSVLVTVEGDNHEKNEAIQRKVEAEIEEVLKGSSFKAAIVEQEILDDDKEIEAFAKEYGISEGKAELVHALAKELTQYTPEQLAKLSINELNILAEGTVKISTKGEASKKKYIGEDKAYEIAFNKAGVTSTQVESTFAKMENDDGVMIYEIEFIANDYEYEVEINAISGAVVGCDKEFSKGFTVKPTNPSNKVDSKVIGEAQAKKIALSKAGISANDISEYKCKPDKDDGKAVYDIEFLSGYYEYDVEVDATTGKVIDYDKELVED